MTDANGAPNFTTKSTLNLGLNANLTTLVGIFTFGIVTFGKVLGACGTPP